MHAGGMRRYLGGGLAWLGATALSVLIASAAVAGIRDRVVDAPVALGAPTSTAAAAVETTSANLLPATTSTTVTGAPVTTTTAPEVTATTAGVPAQTMVTTTTVTTTTAPATTTTTSPPQTTTTVSVSTTTISLIGGTVTLGYNDSEVWVVSALAAAGFIPEIEKPGPGESVEVEFYSDSHKSELSAKVDHGELRIEKDEEPSDGDDD